ncbi:hypothetical protein HMPREF1870_00742 [Bacteroidales bacterium KA00344]|nr:hypothetical protein HMPREF1870_00742 [Bacteroidales bacterium KA00344]
MSTYFKGIFQQKQGVGRDDMENSWTYFQQIAQRGCAPLIIPTAAIPS